LIDHLQKEQNTLKTQMADDQRISIDKVQALYTRLVNQDRDAQALIEHMKMEMQEICMSMKNQYE